MIFLHVTYAMLVVVVVPITLIYAAQEHKQPNEPHRLSEIDAPF